ncbi:MAG: hypothetical protein HQL95_06260 [Magnetococcales bacterium]|nr:hypothetical protein [Magnetococcales bacterium]
MKVKKNKFKGNPDPYWNGYPVGYPPPPYYGAHPQGMPHPQWHPYGAPWPGHVPPGYAPPPPPAYPYPPRPATPMPPPAAESTGEAKDFIGEFLKSPIPSLTNMLGMNDGEFWKGALLGAAAMMLLSGHLGNHEE